MQMDEEDDILERTFLLLYTFDLASSCNVSEY